MRKKLLIIPALLCLTYFALGPAMVFADPQGGTNNPSQGGTNNPSQGGINNPGTITLDNPFKGPKSLFALLRTIIDEIIMPIGGILAVLGFVYAGFLYVTARGSEANLKKAHTALLTVAIGTAVLLGSWMLANVICKTINQLGGPVCVT